MGSVPVGFAMRPLGKAVNLARRGQVLVRGQGKPRIGERVVDARGREVGRIADLVGPVREPYVIVAMSPRADPRRVVGQDLYTR
jgi:rRNA processing protein Gar1